MFLPVESSVLNNLREQHHRTNLYLSIMNAPVLWEARINDPLIVMGETTIAFDNGSGSFFGYIEALQEVWVGTTAGADDIGRLRIKSIASGDAGVTGTVVVSGHSFSINDDHYLTFKHDYPIKPKWSFVDSNEVFYMDDNITYTNQNVELPPVVIAGPHQANHIFAGTLHIRVDASRSYPMSPGATISTYAIQVRSTTGTADVTNFSTSTGAGFIIVTTPGIYWAKYTVTDSDGRSSSSFRCYMVHTEEEEAITAFQRATVEGDWNRGGWESVFKLDGDFDLSTVPDYALAILWHEPIWNDVIGRGTQVIAGHVGPTGDKVVFHNPRVFYTPTGGGNMDITFKTRLTIYGEAPAVGYSTSWNVTVDGCGITPVTEVTTAYGYLEINLSVVGCDPTGTIHFNFNGQDIVQWPFDQSDPHEPFIETYSLTDIGHKNLMVGYVIKDQEEKDTSSGIEKDELYIATAQEMLSKFAFSMSLISIPGTPAYWYEGPSWQTMGTILHHWWYWRSTLFETTDVFNLTDYPLTLRRAMGAFDAGNLYESANEFIQDKGVRCKVISDRMGRLFMTPLHNMLTDLERSNLEIMFEIRRRDRANVVSRVREPINRAPFVDVSGFSWDGSFTAEGIADAQAHCAIAPGGKPDWHGADPASLDFQTWNDAAPAAHARAIAGRFFAAINNHYPEVRLEMAGNYSGVFEVAYPVCWTIDFQPTDLPKGISWVDKRLYCRNVMSIFDGQTGIMNVNTSFEADAPGFDGLSTECPSFPETGGEIPDIPTEDDAGGALVTGASVHYLPPGAGNTWQKRVSQGVLDVIADPFWHIKTGSSSSKDAIMFRCGVGFIRRTTDAWDTTDVNVTPGSNPPNDAGDTPAPTVANLNFEMIEGDWQTINSFVALATWQNSGGVWRSWLWVSDDNMATGEWISISGSSAEVGSYSSTYQFESNSIVFNGSGGGGQSAAKNVAVLDGSTFVVLYYDLDDGEMKVRVGTVASGAISYSSAVTVFSGFVQSEKIVALDNDQFAIVFYDDSIGTTIKVIAGTVVGGIPSTGTPTIITSTAENDCNICKLTNARVLVAYTKAGTPQTGQAVTVAISGTAVGTVSSENEFANYAVDGIDCTSLSGTHVLIAYRDASMGTLLAVAGIIAGSSITFGAEEEISVANTNMVCLKTLSSSKVIFSFENDAGGLSAVVADVVTYSIAPGSAQVVESANIFTNGNIIVSTSSIVFFTYTAFAGGLDGGYTKPAQISGTTISFGTRSLDVDTATNDPIWYSSEALDGITFVTVYEANLGTGESFLIHAVAGYTFRGLGITFTKQAGSGLFWMTGWDGSELVLQEWDVPLISPMSIHLLGAASEAQIDARTYIAFPYAPFWTSDVYVFGRMNNPQGLGNPVHVLVYDGSFASIVDDYDLDHVGSMAIHGSGIMLARNRISGSAKLYVGVLDGAITARGTVPGGQWIGRPRGMAYDRSTGNLYLGSGAPAGIMVLCSYAPFINFINLTFNHETTDGIVAIEVL
jgi:hypothetical protein